MEDKDRRQKLACAALFIVAQQLPSLPLATSSMLHGRRQGAKSATGSAHCIRHLGSFQTLRRIRVTAEPATRFDVLSLGPEQQSMLRGMKHLSELVFDGPVAGESLAGLSALRALDAAGMHGSLPLGELTHLSLRSTLNSSMERMSSLCSLRSLDITQNNLADSTIRALGALTGLTQLSLGGIHRAPGSLDVADLIRGMTCLSHLVYRGPLRSNRFSVDCRAIAHIPLVFLRLEGLNLVHVAAVKSLRTLYLSTCRDFTLDGFSNLTDVTLHRLNSIYQIESQLPFLNHLTRFCVVGERLSITSNILTLDILWKEELLRGLSVTLVPLRHTCDDEMDVWM